MFLRSPPAPWCAGNITVNIDGKFFVPAAELKKLRRDFWAQYSDKLDLSELLAVDTQKMEAFFHESSSIPEKCADKLPEEYFFIPGFISENELSSYQQKISAAYQNGVRHFKIAHWHGFELLKNYSDITISAEFPLPVFNSRSAALLYSLGTSGAMAAPELENDDIDALQKYSPIGITSANGAIPLLVSRIPLPPGQWIDRDGNYYTIVTRDGISELYMD